ncbi:MAG: M4 family metallopeptidase [Bacteroidia bacterium]|nr:M4 family metallopeptidase [Bacteroidia bacterium]
MRKSTVWSMLLIVASALPLSAQIETKGISNPIPFSGIVHFDEFSRPAFDQWQVELHKLAHTSSNTSWKIYSKLEDELGQIHFRAQQYFKGIPLENGVVVVHTSANRILSINGEVIPESMLSGNAELNLEAARNIALSQLPSTQYYWQDETQNHILQDLTGVQDTSWFPQGTVVYCPQNLDFRNPHALCFKYDVFSNVPLGGKRIYVNAQNGSIQAIEDLICHTDVKGTAATAFSGTRTITTDSVSPGNYRLREKTRGKGIETYDMKKGTNYGTAVDFTDADNYWNNVNGNKDEVATDAHWGAERTFDFYDTVLNRKSFDDNNAKILSYVHYSNNYSNAFWNGSFMTYGDGNGSTWRPLTSIDVCGHEISHAVTTYSASLIYSYESGALNESFSDIFGNAIEKWSRPNKWSWKVGEDFTTSAAGIRDMSNPNPYGHPKYYKGISWYGGSGDNGGVHTNSGVQNYWFYLITDGKTGTNEKGNSFSIDSLGLNASARIAYRNLSVYLTKNSQYADARTYSILAATDLYGNCSKAVIAVTNAWWVCGVGNKYDSGFVKADFIADTMVCSLSKSVKFTNLSSNSISSIWYFGDGGTSTNYNALYNYSSYGTYNVKLVAKSCFKNNSDSITKTAYIKVDSTFDICNAVLLPISGTDSATKCQGFIYDDGGEGYYGALKQVSLKVKIPGANSIKFRFLYLDYENGYDSVVLFKNNTSQINKIGVYTGQTTPYGGAWQSVVGNALWLKQYSDPLVEGKGFKIEFEGVRTPLSLDLGNDTLICMGDSLVLLPTIAGGYNPDYRYKWSTNVSTPQITVKPTGLSKYALVLSDACTYHQVKDSIMVDVRPSLSVDLGNDTIICAGRSVQLSALATGGLSTAYAYNWKHTGNTAAVQNVTPASTTVYQVILTDGCSELPDTATKKVTVKPALSVQLKATDTLVCIGKQITLSATGSGGDTLGHIFNWSGGLGTGTSKSITLNDTNTYTVTLTDGCSVLPSSAQIKLYTYPALNISVSSDTLICRGTSVDMMAIANGGLGKNYTYSWNHGKSTSAITEKPATAQFYKITLSDGCSPLVSDSIKVDLMAPLSLSTVNDTTLCDGQTLTLNLTHTGGVLSAHNITWSPVALSGFTPMLNPGTGVNPFRAILDDGCTVKKDTTDFVITKLAPLSANITITPNSICLGDSVKMNFTISGGKTSSRSWSLDGNTVGFLTQKIAPIASKTYQLDLVDGCSVPVNANASVTVNPAASATLSSTPLQVCLGKPVDYTFNSPDAANVRWYFSNGDSVDFNGSPYSKVFTKSGIYTAKAQITTSFGCKAKFDVPTTADVVSYPIAAFTPLPDISTIENPSFDFTDGSTNAETYSWSFGDGTFSSSAGNQNHIYSDTGRYFVNLMVQRAPGCADTVGHWIRIKDVYRIYMPLSFTPDANNINDIYLPKGRGIKTFSMSIYNRWGAKVFETNDMNKGWTGTDESGNLYGPGVYAVLIEILDTEDYRHIEKSTVLILR